MEFPSSGPRSDRMESWSCAAWGPLIDFLLCKASSWRGVHCHRLPQHSPSLENGPQFGPFTMAFEKNMCFH